MALRTIIMVASATAALASVAAQDEAPGVSRADALILAPDGPCWNPDPEDVRAYTTGLLRQRQGYGAGVQLTPAPVIQAEPEAAADQVVVTGGRTPGRVPPVVSDRDTSRFDNGDPNPVKRTTEAPVSTFSADVDTASYAVARRSLCDGALPRSESVRAEEYVNAFDYDYGEPTGPEEPFAVDVAVFPTPWNDETELLRVGIEGFDATPEARPDANVVLLLDVSGSMSSYDKLPLVKTAMTKLVQQLGQNDRVAIVAYAGASGVVLAPTPGSEQETILSALNRLESGGSTAGGEGLALAYALAEENLREDAVNRVILATDGDFNVGVTGDAPLTDFVARKREEGVYLSVLGFGTGNLNDQMMQAIAQNGNGVAAYIDGPDEAERVLVREFTSSMFPIAEDLKIQVEFNPAAIGQYRLVGYQTRQLREEDFENDAVDAGEVGSGHTVTALYEVARTGGPGMLPERRYDEAGPAYDPEAELAFVKLRYKLPGEDESVLLERVVTPDNRQATDADARFAAAVAAFAEKLARTDRAASLTYDGIAATAEDAEGDDPYGDREDFAQLVRIAAALDEGAAGD